MSHCTTSSHKLYVVILSFFLLLIQGCSTLQDLANSVQKPRLSVTDVQVTGFDFNGIDLAFDVTVDNPNALSVQMQSYDYTLDISQQTFASGRQDNQTRIEASGQSTFEVPIRLDFKEIYTTAENLANRDEAAYQFKSTFAFDLPGLGRTEVPVRHSGDIPLLRLPSIRINSLRVEELRLSSAKVTLGMEFDNPNGIGFDINGFEYSLDIDGRQWAQGKALENINIARDGVTQLDIPINLDIAQMGVSAFQLLSGSQDVGYELDGNFSLDADQPLLGVIDFTFNRDGEVSLQR
ncbi:LEA type 2 family protein [Aliifodinibius sp. S!AR15-10]|uniref:LEA type 2 family protein n=1 Tax=Aliifodinibius sp. S!AR15-10 TaxID=2950437 RepID=UPI00285D9B78|nr:LEA type 2 family protein [Aliifodinibius sp. S!AR15-10]MDR8391968.1 LEA type 2 family protein [Aliifodinibius sp. S!AR15-10]